MDPHIYSGQPGSPPDSSDGEEGVNYLRRLKATVAEGAPAAGNPAPNGGGRAPADANSPEWEERRQSPRLRCSGSAEFRTEGSAVRMWGTLTDVSLHGCYVEMHTTFPIGTKVDLVLKSFGIRIQASGTVRTSYPFLGMGICFAEIEAEQQPQLKQLLDALSGPSAVSNGVSADGSDMKDVLASADPKAFLDEIAKFFQKRHVLHRAEFHQIAKRVRRS
ncbi:MAG: PilZ domain-containing protein [Terriglobales bacterium]